MHNSTDNITPARITRGSSQFRAVNGALFIAGFVTFITLYDVQPLLPVFAAEYRLPAATASLPLSIATCALAVTMLVMGTVSEAVGRKPVMVASLLLTSLLALATPLTQTMPALLVLRLLQGAVLAGLPAVAMAYLGEEMDLSALGSAMGLYIGGNAVGGMTGRIFTAAVSEAYSWRLAIGVIGIICLVLSCYFSKKLPPSTHFRPRPLRPAYLVTSLAGHLQDSCLLLLFLIAFLLTGCFVTIYNYITFRLLEQPYLMSHTAASALFLVYLVGTLASASTGRLLRTIGRRRTLLLCISSMLLGTLLTLAQPVAMIVAGISLFTAGFFAAHTTASSWVSSRAVTAKAQASSLYLFFYYLGSSVSGTLGGVFWSASGWSGVAGMIGALLLTALLVAVLLSRACGAVSAAVEGGGAAFEGGK